MMCPADEASLTQRLRRNTKTDADDSGSYGQYSYNRYSLDNICNQMATKQSNSQNHNRGMTLQFTGADHNFY